jgi:breast cancer 2 susceptibility protein
VSLRLAFSALVCPTYLLLLETNRYEREINRAQRPPVRLIQERDSPSTRPLILLVSEIHWTEDEETGKRGVECVELTDGWYKIMGKVDDPLTKACLGGKIVIGSKIAMAGIKVESLSQADDRLR